MEETITRNYKNPSHPTAYSGLNSVYNYYKENHPEFNLSYKKLREILAGIEAYTRHRESKHFQRNPTYVYNVRDQIQIDLVDVRHLSQYNDGYKYLLNGIDIFSRRGFSIPLKSKTAIDTLDGFKQLLQQAEKYPKSVLSDRGSEIKNYRMTSFCKENNIRLNYADTSIHAAFVERFNRTLQLLTYKFLTENETYRYIDVLPDLLLAYNTRKHRMIGMTPLEAEKQENSTQVRLANEKRYVKARRSNPKYKVGQDVRISIQKGKFSRGYDPQQIEEVFKIKSISTTLPIPLYTLQNYDSNEVIEGKFYEYELTPVKKETFAIEKVIRTKHKKGEKFLLVKWRGYKEPSWIKESDIVV